MRFVERQQPRAGYSLGGLAFVALLIGGVAGTVLAGVVQTVSQKGREFQPGEMTIKRGEMIAIVNDDADLLHHAYLKSTAFSFDSGDQKPGSRFEVAFPEIGTFTIRCAIHPKMKLVVKVQ
ncbi:MAG TPA: hypothetical protein VNQ56_15605 [Pseudolabrys sp.]|nr:hypothetical protein [Pseudolabrys sp.]